MSANVCEVRESAKDSDGKNDHCWHDAKGATDVCCWCGDKVNDSAHGATHGPHAPRSVLTVVLAEMIEQGARAERARIRRRLMKLRGEMSTAYRLNQFVRQALDEALRACRAPRQRRSK